MARYLIDRYNVRVMDSGYRLLAARYICRQIELLAEQLDGVRAAEDIEFVHRARVATRRLRAALRMFKGCFAGRQWRRWRNAIRRTTAKLGNARDHDVQIELLCGIQSALTAKECFPGICRILIQLERDRERLQRKVVKAIDRFRLDGVLDSMRRVNESIMYEAAGTAGSEDVQTYAARAETRRHILHRIERVLRRQDCLANAEDKLRHHRMRIAVKRLRYTLEISRPVYPAQLDEAVEAMKRVQSLLGEVHDCDVWADQLDVFAAHQRRRIKALFGHAGRFNRLQPGIDHLRADRRRHREEVFGQLVEYWGELGRNGLWERLTNAVLADGKSSTGAGSESILTPAP
jgi:CHAD domain-containing protein